MRASKLSFELPDDAAARQRAQQLADKTGQQITVTDEQGRKVCRTQPARRNQLIVLPKT